MIILQIALNGSQTETHCSQTSSIGRCARLRIAPGERPTKCLQYNKWLEYDYDAHAYERCEECKRAEIK